MNTMKKRRLLSVVVSYTWENGESQATLREMLRLIAEMAQFASGVRADSGRYLTDHSGWVRNPDANGNI